MPLSEQALMAVGGQWVLEDYETSNIAKPDITDYRGFTWVLSPLTNLPAV
jgi:hypothetical protein